jgi:hypothetical protein
MSFPNDKLWIKLTGKYIYIFKAFFDLLKIELPPTVYSLLILDLIHTAALSSSSWSFLCSGWGRPENLEFTEWGFALIPLASGACEYFVFVLFNATTFLC